eukprot:scaffold87507_cov28-Tisochrysis_lutea.AAC.1
MASNLRLLLLSIGPRRSRSSLVWDHHVVHKRQKGGLNVESSGCLIVPSLNQWSMGQARAWSEEKS